MSGAASTGYRTPETRAEKRATVIKYYQSKIENRFKNKSRFRDYVAERDRFKTESDENIGNEFNRIWAKKKDTADRQLMTTHTAVEASNSRVWQQQADRNYIAAGSDDFQRRSRQQTISTRDMRDELILSGREPHVSQAVDRHYQFSRSELPSIPARPHQPVSRAQAGVSAKPKAHPDMDVSKWVSSIEL